MSTAKTSLDSIVCAAVEIASAEARTLYLAQACGDDQGLRRRAEKLVAAHFNAGSFLDKPISEQLAGQGTPDELDETQGEAATDGNDLGFLMPSDKPNVLGRLGHYDILEVIGKGGMGIVLRAVDEKLHRVVAIKVMAVQLATNGAARKRFMREARAAAAVSHDHIVTIHAVEETAGHPYLVMQCVSGMSLQERLDRSGPLQLAEIVRIGMQTAAGLAAAHAQGVVHRDVKPANILLENGIERVKITDFGLARAGADANLTQSGAVAGTPSFMSPEQARGEPVDQRTDLFSLGSVLYAMCTGRAPFRAGSSLAVLKRVCEDTPRPIGETNPDIPDWLVAIIDRLHAMDPACRYQSAAEVAGLFSQHLAHLQHPSLAAPPTKRTGVVSTKAPSQRRRVVVVALLFCVAAGLVWTEATGVTSLRTIVTGLFPHSGPDTGPTKDNGKPDSGAAPTLPDFPVGEVRRHLWPNRGAYCARFSPDGKYYAATGEAGGLGPTTVRVWELASGKLVMEVTGNEFALFTTDSKRLIAAGPDKQIHVWDLATCSEFARFGEHPDWIGWASLSPDGNHLLTSCRDGIVRLWDFATGKETARLECDTKVFYPQFCPEGKRFLTMDEDGIIIRLWDLAQRKEIRRWQQPESRLGLARFLPGGQRFFTYGTHSVFFWDMAADKEAHSLRLVGKHVGVAVSPDGSRLLYTVENDSLMRLVEASHGKEVATFPTIETVAPLFHGMEFSPDGRFAVAASWGVVYVWRLPDPPAAGKK